LFGQAAYYYSQNLCGDIHQQSTFGCSWEHAINSTNILPAAGLRIDRLCPRIGSHAHFSKYGIDWNSTILPWSMMQLNYCWLLGITNTQTTEIVLC
jgi:hypothetical protein